jgi:predicted transcriptional regulator
MKQSKLQLLRRYLKFINLSQADIKKIVFGANIFYSGAPELTPGLNSGVRVSRFLCSVL